MKYYSIKDKKLSLYNEPFAAADSDQAILIVSSTIARSQLPSPSLKRIYDDCQLVSVGYFDMRTGKFVDDKDNFTLDLSNLIPKEDSDA